MLCDNSVDMILDREKHDLLAMFQREFWESLISQTIKKHSYQSDFSLVPNNLTSDNIIQHIKKSLSDTCWEYKLDFSMDSRPGRTEFFIGLFKPSEGEKTIGMFSVVVCLSDICLRILPTHPWLKQFYLEDFILVENVLQDACFELFKNQEEKAKRYHVYIKKINECAEGLNLKSIQIAQNSIKAIYEASAQKNKSLVQRNLYSTMLIHGKSVRVMHKDFLENPSVLTSKLTGQTPRSRDMGIAIC